jgi:hypothetical protein
MKDLASINKSINNIMEKHITENGYADYVLFESKVLFNNGTVMFTMMMKQGLLKTEPFKLVFPACFLVLNGEDDSVKMICDCFKAYLNNCEKIDNNHIADDRDTPSPFTLK